MKAVVWSKNNCAYCTQAKQLLQAKSIAFTERNIDNTASIADLQLAVPGARTVPQIFIDGTLIGGFTELKTYLQKALP
jgi:glutaredoxin 3